MKKGKGSDQFGLDSTMNAAGKKRLSEQPSSSRDVRGIAGCEAHNGGLPKGPTDRHNVAGSKLQGSKS